MVMGLILRAVSIVAFVAMLAMSAFIFGLPELRQQQSAMAEENLDQPIRDAFFETDLRKFDPDKLGKTASTLVRTYDRNDDGITADELDKFEVSLHRSNRRETLDRLLSYDLNADLTITRQEIERWWAFRFPRQEDQKRKRIERDIDELMEADPNDDGRIEPSEFQKLKSSRGYPAAMSRRRLLELLFQRDPNSDGRLTAQEINAIGEPLFAKDEGPSFNPGERHKERLIAKRLSRECPAPQASADSEVIVVGAVMADALSNIMTVRGMFPATTAIVNVEAGDKPLYIVLLSVGSVIWRFEGATERVEQVLLATIDFKERAISGVTGLPADRVSSTTTPPCPLQMNKKNKIYTTEQTERQLKPIIGRQADRGFAFKTVGTIFLPSGMHMTTSTLKSDTGHSALKWAESRLKDMEDVGEELNRERLTLQVLLSKFKEAYPGGIGKVVSEKVVSDLPIKTHAVLPGDAGILQLLRDGALKIGPGGQLHILEKIEFPRGSFSDSRRKYMLMPGVPEPDVIPHNICLFSVDRRAYSGQCS